MNQVRTLLIATFLIVAFSASAQWTQVEWAQTDWLHFIDFVDDETGYARMDLMEGFSSSLEKTEDGGQSWTELNLPVSAYDVMDMDFTSPSEGVIICRTFVDQDVLTRIFRTTDDGASWEDISTDETAVGFGMAEIQMPDENTIVCVTDNYFYRTVDGGETWTSVLLPKAGVSVHFFDADHGVVGTWDGTFLYGGSMLATTDGGETWNETVLEYGNSVIGVVHQFSETSAYAAPVKWGAHGQSAFYKTTNNGIDWSMVSVPETSDNATLTGFDFKDDNNGVVTLASMDQFYIYHTTDGGESWNLQHQMDQLNITDISLTANSGYISADKGLLLRLNASLGVVERGGFDLKLYPNPAVSGQSIQWDADVEFTQIEIVDVTGKTVFLENITGQKAVLPNLNSGLYYVSLRNETVRKTIKIVVD